VEDEKTSNSVLKPLLCVVGFLLLLTILTTYSRSAFARKTALFELKLLYLNAIQWEVVMQIWQTHLNQHTLPKRNSKQNTSNHDSENWDCAKALSNSSKPTTEAIVDQNSFSQRYEKVILDQKKLFPKVWKSDFGTKTQLRTRSRKSFWWAWVQLLNIKKNVSEQKQLLNNRECFWTKQLFPKHNYEESSFLYLILIGNTLMSPSIPRYPTQTKLNMTENCENREQQTRNNTSAGIEINDWYIM
jgi:hypothetical protein